MRLGLIKILKVIDLLLEFIFKIMNEEKQYGLKHFNFIDNNKSEYLTTTQPIQTQTRPLNKLYRKDKHVGGNRNLLFVI